MKINLYHEIVKTLYENDKTLKDISWVGTKEAAIDTISFIEEAKHTEYDNDYGEAIIDLDLIIVGVDWWLSRGEYDGAEWWIYNILPQRPGMQKTKFDLTESSMWSKQNGEKLE